MGEWCGVVCVCGACMHVCVGGQRAGRTRERLGQGHHVWLDPVVLVTPQLAGAAQADLRAQPGEGGEGLWVGLLASTAQLCARTHGTVAQTHADRYRERAPIERENKRDRRADLDLVKHEQSARLVAQRAQRGQELGASCTHPTG
jgi:hypothetical protein